MRVRTIAVAAAAAVAVLATTAAVFPGAPAEHLQPLPPLSAQALAARYAADSERITQAARAAGRAGDHDLARALEALRGQHFLDFSLDGPDGPGGPGGPGGRNDPGLAVEVVGDLARATRVAVLVPGSDTSLTTFASRGTASPAGGAGALAAEAGRLVPGARLAVIAWLGYATPSTLSPAVLTSGDAGQGASALRTLVDGLAAGGKQVALLCHSYGSVVCGLAAPHLPVTDIAVAGSPGMDASSVAALHTTARVWAGRGTGDWIRDVPHVRLLGLGFGPDPAAPAFGARRFDCGSGGHSGYFQPGGVALRNLASIALGDPAGVTR